MICLAINQELERSRDQEKLDKSPQALLTSTVFVIDSAAAHVDLMIPEMTSTKFSSNKAKENEKT